MCCGIEQGTLSDLLQSTRLINEYYYFVGHRTYISKIVAASLNDSPKSFWSDLYVEKKLAILLLELALVYQRHPTVQMPMPQMNNSNSFTDEEMQELPSCIEPFPDTAEIHFDIDGIIKELQKINPYKANGRDNVLARFLRKTVMKCGAIFCQSYLHGTLSSHCTHALVFPVYEKARNLSQ